MWSLLNINWTHYHRILSHFLTCKLEQRLISSIKIICHALDIGNPCMQTSQFLQTQQQQAIQEWIWISFKTLVLGQLCLNSKAITKVVLKLIFTTQNWSSIHIKSENGSNLSKKYIYKNMRLNAITLICSLLLIGAVGKSAQIGSHTESGLPLKTSMKTPESLSSFNECPRPFLDGS